MEQKNAGDKCWYGDHTFVCGYKPPPSGCSGLDCTGQDLVNIGQIASSMD